MSTTNTRDDVSVYYQNSGSVPFASKLSQQARTKMFRTFWEFFSPGPETTILDVGVTSDTSFQESNYFEMLYPFPNQIVCVGTEDGSHLPALRPGLRYQRVEAGRPLPFADRAFDIVFSNAVVEHVGSRESQSAFVRELCRVARGFCITTPNRWFPVEHHTGIPLLHYLPPGLFRRLIGNTRYHHWAQEENLNILTAASFARLFPNGIKPCIRRIRLAGITSNMVALGRVESR